jgi:hypothetical protein
MQESFHNIPEELKVDADDRLDLEDESVAKRVEASTFRVGESILPEIPHVSAEPQGDIIIPPGRFAAPGDMKILGKIGQLETESPDASYYFAISASPEDSLDFFVLGPAGEQLPLIRLHAEYDSQIGRHRGVMVVSDRELFDSLSRRPGFDEALHYYQEEIVHNGASFFARRDRESNNHRIFSQRVTVAGEEREVEMIQQVRAGDCVIAAYLNTFSLEHEGRLPETVREARLRAIQARRLHGEASNDIEQPDSALSYMDTVRLFGGIYGVPPRQDDLVMLDGRVASQAEMQLKVLDLLDKLDGYPSGVCVTGMSGHARTIKKLDGGTYGLIDPFFASGIKRMTPEALTQFIASECLGRDTNSNFFFFLRK